MAEIQKNNDPFALGIRGYYEFACGLAVLNHPLGVGVRDLYPDWDPEIPSQRHDIVHHGQKRIWVGLSQVIRAANPGIKSLTGMENNYETARPKMAKIVEDAYYFGGRLLASYHARFPIERPFPLLDNNNTYRAIAHGNCHRVHVRDVMGRFAVSRLLDDWVTAESTFAEIRNLPIPMHEDLEGLTSEDNSERNVLIN